MPIKLYLYAYKVISIGIRSYIYKVNHKSAQGDSFNKEEARDKLNAPKSNYLPLCKKDSYPFYFISNLFLLTLPIR